MQKIRLFDQKLRSQQVKRTLVTVVLILVCLIQTAFQGIPYDSISRDPSIINRGEELFSQYCFQCHEMGMEKIGPDLTSVYDFYDFPWLYGFITNSDSLIARGDTLALSIYNYYKKVPMPDHKLSKGDVASIISYVKFKSDNPTGPVLLDQDSERGPGLNWPVFGVLILIVIAVILLFLRMALRARKS
jgi:mono/diheme cytochrome c family protein